MKSSVPEPVTSVLGARELASSVGRTVGRCPCHRLRVGRQRRTATCSEPTTVPELVTTTTTPPPAAFDVTVTDYVLRFNTFQVPVLGSTGERLSLDPPIDLT